MTDVLGRNLESLAIGPVLLVFGQYIAPVAATRLISSHDQIEASNLSAGVGFVLSVALRSVLINASYRTKRISIVISLLITLALLAYCYHIWGVLAQGLQPAEVDALQGQQFFVFVAAVSFFCLTIILSPLAYPTSYSWIISAVLVIVAILVVGLVVLYLWHRYH